MTNTLTYNNATVSTWSGANSATASFGLINFGSAHSHNRNPRYSHRSLAQALANVQTLVKQAGDSIVDHAALLMVAGVVTGMFGMATAIGIGISL
jgi:hypothetical protein